MTTQVPPPRPPAVDPLGLTPHLMRNLTHPPGELTSLPTAPTGDERGHDWQIAYCYRVPSGNLQRLLGLLECRQDILSRLGLVHRPPVDPETHPQGEEVLVVVSLRWTSPEAFQLACEARELVPYERLLASLCSRVALRRGDAAEGELVGP